MDLLDKPQKARGGNKASQCNYKFDMMLIDNKMYRIPKMNFNSKPFNGENFDAQVIKRAEMWRGTQQDEEEKSVREENAQA